MFCEPAHSIIQITGGISATAKTLSVGQSSVQRWRTPPQRGGTGGYIPRKYHAALIEAAAQRGVALSVAAFVDPAALPGAAPSTDSDAPPPDASLAGGCMAAPAPGARPTEGEPGLYPAGLPNRSD